MRKTIHVALALLCTVLLVGCKTSEQKEAERQQMLAEMNEAAQARNELRKAYCNSMLCTTGRAYLEAALEELVPGCEYTVDMEPDGMLLKEEPSEQFSIVVTDAETARLCFTNFYATIKVDYWNHGVEAEKLCAALLERGIGGRIADGENSHGNAWLLDARNGTYEYYQQPGV